MSLNNYLNMRLKKNLNMMLSIKINMWLNKCETEYCKTQLNIKISILCEVECDAGCEVNVSL